MKKFFLFMPLLVTACVVSPYNDQFGGAPGEPIDFSGFAITPDEPLEIQALDKSDNEWVTVETTQSASDYTYVIQGWELYPFAATVTLNYTSFGTDNCFYGYSPVAGCIAEGLPKLRVYQPHYGATYTTFEQDGISCMVSELQGGNDLLSALSECESPDSPVITMQWLW